MLALLACRGDSGPASGWDGAVRDSARIEIIENFGAPLWPEGPGWEFTEVFRIGAADGPPEYQFGHITGLYVLSDGRIVIADMVGHHLRFYSPGGVYERTVGREGQGPGEFGNGRLALFLGPGDTLVVYDRANSRANVVTPDGTWLESFSTLPRDGHRLGYWGNSPQTGRITTLHNPLRQSDGTLTDTLDIVLERDVHGAILDTLAQLPSYLTFFPGGPETFRFYYVTAWWHRPWGDGLLLNRTDQYRFLWHGPDGALRRIVSLAREPLAITDEDRSVIVGRWEATLRENRVSAERAAEILSGIRFGDNYPPFAWFSYGPAGTFLVQRVRPLRDLDAEEQKEIRLSLMVPPASSEWDVFDRGWRYLGGVVIPETEWIGTVPSLRFFLDRATGTWYMYTIWSDELDIEYVIRWRIDGRMPDDIEAASADEFDGAT
ncbi:MAG: hypothetical protein JSV86_18355 [Gemmatimonadota bacterium]|nr:MAG: hypothetical protein JSV86_18355 [Gemmatimonadota bacterium]